MNHTDCIEKQGRCHTVLVHGTWGAGFLRSLFWNCKCCPIKKHDLRLGWGICNELREGNINLFYFSWSGKNSHYWRRRAGNELTRYLRKEVYPQMGPRDSLYLIAHSHGGNVVRYALRWQSVRNKVRGIVFLSTPFLHFSKQSFDFSSFRGLPVAYALSVGGLINYSYAMLFIPYFLDNPSDDLLLASKITVVVLSFGLGGFGFLATQKILTKFEDRWNLIREPASARYLSDPTDKQRFLIISKVGDEASAALGSGRFIEWLISLAWGFLNGILALPRMLLNKFGVYIPTFVKSYLKLLQSFSTFLLAGLFILLVINFFYWQINYEFVILPAWVIVGSISFVCGVLLILVGCIGVLNIIRFGRGAKWTTTFFYQVTTELTPKGSWKIELFPAKGFAHASHSDPQVSEKVGKWLLQGGAVSHRSERSKFNRGYLP